jgi:hypothetical protein
MGIWASIAGLAARNGLFLNVGDDTLSVETSFDVKDAEELIIPDVRFGAK